MMGFPGGSDSKESVCSAGDLGSIPGSGRSPGGGHGNPLQYSCLENSMDRGARQASPWGHKESDTTEWLNISHSHDIIPQLTLLDLSGQLYLSWLTQASWIQQDQGRVKTFLSNDKFLSPNAGPQFLIWHHQVQVLFMFNMLQISEMQYTIYII